MTHREHINAGPALSTPCAAWHLTFGGRCLNCGWDPDPIRFDPEQCRECGAPFNDADAPSHGLCPACYA